MRANGVTLVSVVFWWLASCSTTPEETGPDAVTDTGCDDCDATGDAGSDDIENNDVADVTDDVVADTVADIDAGEPDAEPADVAPDVAAEDTAEGSDDVAAVPLLSIVTPADRTSHEIGDEIEILAVVENVDPTDVSVVFESDVDGPLGEGSGDGIDAWWLVVDDLSPGIHTITARAEVDDVTLVDSVMLGICGWPAPFTFDADLDADVWTVVGDATRDPRGWLELTGNAQSRRGAIVNTVDEIAGGDVRFRFDVSTGQCADPGPCSGNGADGFALSVYGVADPTTLPALVGGAEYGGGLGYGLAGGYGDLEIDAFHIEFDTYYNSINGAEFHTDPTMTNHVGITLDGDPGNHVLWANLPDLEDNEWHSVEIVIDGINISVSWDGEVVTSGDVPGFSFKGGYVVFTGSTGYYSNYHRFDNLSIYEACTF